jgi:sulfite dehydrogenase (quinone) subunit SoeC
VGLGASFLHLGRPLRAWRAAAMWRTSWLSREVIVLPAFIAVVGLWWLALQWAPPAVSVPAWWPWPVLALAALLWLCTAMIYACIRFIAEWAHPLTVAYYGVMGLASGALLLGTGAVLAGDPAFARGLVPLLVFMMGAAWALRGITLRRNRGLKPASTLHTATGLRGTPLVQKSMGMSAGSFNTREFFHGASAAAVRHVRWALHGLCFGLPLLLLLGLWAGGPVTLLPLALLVHVPGLLAERWLFFAQARHPQNLYYQQVS